MIEPSNSKRRKPRVPIWMLIAVPLAVAIIAYCAYPAASKRNPLPHVPVPAAIAERFAGTYIRRFGGTIALDLNPDGSYRETFRPQSGVMPPEVALGNWRISEKHLILSEFMENDHLADGTQTFEVVDTGAGDVFVGPPNGEIFKQFGPTESSCFAKTPIDPKLERIMHRKEIN